MKKELQTAIRLTRFKRWQRFLWLLPNLKWKAEGVRKDWDGKEEDLRGVDISARFKTLKECRDRVSSSKKTSHGRSYAMSDYKCAKKSALGV